MYAIVNVAGVQVKASPNEIMEVPLLDAEPGATVEFGEVLLVADGDKITLGRPHVANAKLTATVLAHGRGKKIIVAVFKRRKDFRKKKGHRQDFTRIQITGIQS
jgi:large subunit ribosomal protein L21